MKVMLKNTLGLTNDKGEYVYVGPGEAEVPDAYVEALGLEPVKEVEPAPKPTGPFVSLPSSAQKALADAGITTVAEAKLKTKEELVAMPGIGDVSADKILALPDEESSKED